ncbi:MAG: OmpA family protein [Bdellovibrionaceae bacterium]|nr:OmpA family protein [Pseudobdellovibrionaceae bacterium]
MRSILLATLVLLTGNFVHAQDGASRAELYQSESYLSEGWKPFVGMSSGFMSSGGRHEVEGLPTSIKALGSYYTEDAQWVFDIGGGLQHQFMSAGRNSTLPMVEASARYQMGLGWQLGPIMNTYLADSARYGSANTNFTSFIGAAANKDFIWEGQLLRAGATVMTDLDIRDEQVLVMMANLQISFGGEPETSEPLALEEEPAAADHLIRQAQATLPEQKPLARFALQSSELSAPDRTYLRRVASLLKNNASQYRSVTLVGHTDPTGPERLNERLSVARAQSVKRYLEQQGVPANKLVVAGRASRELVSQEELSPNRRVEIKFTSGVPTHLDNALRSIE